MRKIILASASPRRKKALAGTRLKFIVQPSSFKENLKLKLKPVELVKVLSRGKAEAVAKKHKNAIVIGADTIVLFGQEIMGKPYTIKKAKAMLRKLSGKAHFVVSGFTIIDSKTGKILSRAAITKIFFKKLNKREIDGYVKSGQSLDRAGAYDLSGLGSVFVKKIEGDYTNCSGLPVGELVKELNKFGVEILK